MINNQCIFDYRHFYGFQVPWLHPACGLVEALAKSRWTEEQGRACVQVPKNHLQMDVAPWCKMWIGSMMRIPHSQPQDDRFPHTSYMSYTMHAHLLEDHI